MTTPTSVRVDSWIWAVRLLRTRSVAASECRAGHVSVNGEKAKPAQVIRVGDEVRVRGSEVERVVVVNRLLTKRVSATVAAECLTDNTPPPPTREEAPALIARDRGAGRPTKRERRDIARLRGH